MPESDPIDSYLRSRGLSPPDQRLLLRGERRAVLCTNREGGWLLELSRGGVTRALALDERSHVQWQRGSLQHQLHIAELSYSVRPHTARAALNLIGIARYRSQSRERALNLGSFVRAATPLHLAFLNHQLTPNEILLAWLPTDQELGGESSSVGVWRGKAWFLLTDQAQMLISISDAGDVSKSPLQGQPLSVARGGDISLGGITWQSQDLEHFKQLPEALRLTGTDRVLELARLEWLAARSNRKRTLHVVPQEVTRLVRGVGTAEARLLRAGLGLELNEASAPALSLSDLFLDVGPGFPFLATWRKWQLSDSTLERLLKAMPKDSSWASAAEYLSQSLLDKWRNAEPHAELNAELNHAQTLLDYGQIESAKALLSTSESHLPPPDLGDIDLPTGSRHSPGYSARRRWLELTLIAHQDSPFKYVQALRRLAELEPLNPLHLERLRVCADEPIRSRAEQCWLLLKRAEQPSTGSVQRHGLRELTEALQKERLTHPLARVETPWMARIQAWIAKTHQPDLATLRLYCERVTDADATLTRIVDEACQMLGLNHTDVFVSRGHDDVGIRAFAGDNGFLLIGGQHLEEASKYHMSELELRFVVTSELLHIKFGHVRVAPQDVFKGALAKSKQGADIALSILPVLKGIKLANRLGMVTAKLSLPQVGRAVRAAKTLGQAVTPSGGDSTQSDLATANEELIAAHRIMQFSADRAGLLACGDVTAAVHGILAARSGYVRLRAELRRTGLLNAIGSTRADDEARRDLLVRIGMLLTFYLSEDYTLLATACSSEPFLSTQPIAEDTRAKA